MIKSIFKKLILFTFLFLLFTTQTVIAQIDLGVPVVAGKVGATTLLRDYEAIGVNPSNLGWDYNNRISLGIGYFNFNLQSKALDLKEITSSMKSMNSDDNSSEDEFTNELGKLFTCENGLNISTNVNLVGLSLHLGGFGGIALSMRDRLISQISTDVKSQAMLDSLLKGGDNGPVISEVFNSAKVNIQYLRELNIAYGFKINTLIKNLDIYGGVGYRYILGLGYVNVNAENGIIVAQSTLNNKNYQPFVDNLPSSIFNADGHGSAFDLGVNAVLKNKFKFGISVVDLGSIKWRSMEMVKANTTMLRADSLQKIVKTFDDLFNQNDLFSKFPSSTVSLPAKLRIGAGIRLSRLFEVGADIVTPLNKINNYKDKTYMSLGAEFNFLGLFKVNTGVAGNPSIGWNVPLGITFSAAGFYDIYFATNDILTFMGNTKNPVLSFAVCALRLNLPPRRIKNIVKQPEIIKQPEIEVK